MTLVSVIPKRKKITAKRSKVVRRKIEMSDEMLQNTTGNEHKFWMKYQECLIYEKPQSFKIEVIEALDIPNFHLWVEESDFFPTKLSDYIVELNKELEEFTLIKQSIGTSEKKKIKIGEKSYDAIVSNFIIII